MINVNSKANAALQELDSPETHAVELDTDIDAATPIALPASHSSSDEDGIQMYLEHIQALPYKAESIEEMDRRLDLIMRRLVDCVETKDFDVGVSLFPVACARICVLSIGTVLSYHNGVIGWSGILQYFK